MTDLATILAQLGTIFYTIVLPILLIAGIGFFLQRRLGLDMATLRRLNFYYVIPAMIYTSLVGSSLAGTQMVQIIGFTLAMQGGIGAVSYVAGAVRGVPRDARTALLMTTVYNNSGNYGLPLQDLAFRQSGLGAEAMGAQVFVMVTQNLTGFTAGIFLVAAGAHEKARPSWRENLRHIVKLPPIYAMAAAGVTVQIAAWLGPDHARDLARAIAPLWQVLLYIRDAFLGVALLTLGAQLGAVRRAANAAGEPVKLSVLLRLLGGPVVALVLLWLFGIRGFLAQVLLIGSATPTAVNAMLLCLEFDNHPGFAARAVLYSTLISPITVTATIFLARMGIL